ncbi:MAG: hypothetical protein DRI79_00210 [Chloroflexi bacterium]|nr:MAG: hypothetical protein DRI79_00210 [Chloroflexota bacterium]
MKVLISLLGLSPGVVTGAYYALYHGWGIDEPVRVDKVVTLGTSEVGVDRFESEIAREFERWRQETGIQVQYDDSCREHITAEDLRDEESVHEFREKITRLLREDYRNDDVYLVVAGGRKSMAALAAVAAQLYGYGVRGMYHLYVDRNLEEDGSPDRFWKIDLEQRRKVMRPPEGQCRLVDVAFFQIRPGVQGAQLVLCGRMQDYILDYLADNPELVTVLEPDTRGQVLGYVFEAQVANYLRDKGYDARQSKKIGQYEIDVYAERGDEILICECQFRENPAQPIESKKINQAIDRLKYLREQLPERQISAWVVSNVDMLEDDVNLWPKIREWGIEIRQAPLRPKVLRRIQHQSWAALLRENWLAEEIRQVKPSEDDLSLSL